MKDYEKTKGSEGEPGKEGVDAIAARCLEDSAFARQVLAGDDHPAVRSAIIADLEEARGGSAALNPQPIPPGHRGFGSSLWVQQEKIWGQWSNLDRSNLKSLLRR
jgi:hypothetical protein